MGAAFSKKKVGRIRTAEELRTLLRMNNPKKRYLTESNYRDIEALLANDDEEIAKKSLEVIQQEFMCGICRDLVREARLNMWCGHFFCKTCIEKWKDSTTHRIVDGDDATICPTCRMFLPDYMQVRYFQADDIFELVTVCSEIYKKEILEEIEEIARITQKEAPNPFL